MQAGKKIRMRGVTIYCQPYLLLTTMTVKNKAVKGVQGIAFSILISHKLGAAAFCKLYTDGLSRSWGSKRRANAISSSVTASSQKPVASDVASATGPKTPETVRPAL